MTTSASAINRSSFVLFASTLFCGAFLLFQVQPLIAKFILPWFGGSPSVWTTCVLYFQLILLAGYAYAHLSLKYLTPRAQSLVHIALLILAAATLPITPSLSWKPRSSADPTWRILALLAVSTGVPGLLVASTGPLMQAWLARLAPAASPYRLFALSNLASLGALLSYPVLIEPFLSRRAQAIGWSVAFAVFALLSAVCALASRRPDPKVDQASITAAPSSSSFTRLLWLLLPACGTLLLLATTNKICQEVAVIPFLWILPLSIYLLTFVIAFDSPHWYRRGVLLTLLPITITGVIVMLLLGGDVAIWLQLAAYCSALFVACLICHGELARLKPHPSQLTRYYLYLCAGGALGGIFVAILAPLLFTSYFEFPLSLLITAALAGVMVLTDKTSRLYRGQTSAAWFALVLFYTLLGGALIVAHNGTSDQIIAASRSFYGDLAVISRDSDKPQLARYVFRHGRITHGIQFASPKLRDQPTTYFGRTSGVGLALAHFPATTPRKIGVVGLGAGTLAVYGLPADTFRFYEINPHVLTYAQSYFTFLKDSPAHIEHVLGDARLSLEREPDQHFDILILDAFNGDAIPVHLITGEAFDLYRRHLNPQGLIVVQITNHYLDLRPVVQGAADYLHLKSRYIQDEHKDSISLYSSEWMLLSPDEDFLKSLPAPNSSRAPAKAARLWTDDQTSLFPILR